MQINLNQKFYHAITENQDNHKRVNKEKAKALLRALLYLGLSAAVFYGTYRFYLWQVKPYFLSYFSPYSSYPFEGSHRYGTKAVAAGFGILLFSVFIGIQVLAKSIATVIRYFNTKKLHLEEKAVLDELKRLYRIKR
jgi:hypothetical protein